MKIENTFALFDLLETWKPSSDVFVLKYWYHILGATTGYSAYVLNNQARKYVKLRNKALFVSLLPIAFLPSILGSVVHYKFVVEPIVEREKLVCPICIQVRAGIIQSCAAVLYPFALSPLIAFFNAEKYYTFALPAIEKEPLELVKLVPKMFKPIKSKILLLLMLNLSGAMIVTHYEMKNWETVITKTVVGEQELGEVIVERLKNKIENPDIKYNK